MFGRFYQVITMLATNQVHHVPFDKRGIINSISKFCLVIDLTDHIYSLLAMDHQPHCLLGLPQTVGCTLYNEE
jgi:hypothetical protein